MKGAVISLSVMALIIFAVIAEGLFVSCAMSDIEASLSEADPDKFGWECTLSALNDAKEAFDKKMTVLSLTVKDRELSEISGYLGELSAAAAKESEEEFAIMKSRLISVLSETRQLHGFGLKSIF